ncbi:Sugar phosphate isomerase/epimerase [Singulisphaera sp. GP187]|uniref:sugar phosphate isomerase/epimerase family protein n=1 Tax=Singulisphaera sp. GP187 TaxID=1882752 RepID=UPI00092AC0DB|nr:sugar phosphate isomerase/epimerase family protein [Singulisphaera sp. GP187]SIO60372.1 Sugar phosphate isomerase/epimerase [Singulisphaera sp. GP187]
MAIRSAVTISLVPEARGGPFVFWDDLAGACRKASELGFDAVEIFPPGPDEVDPVALRTLLAGHGLALAAVGTGAGWVKHRLNLVHPESSVRSRARDFIRAIIDFAGPFQAPAIIGSMQGRSGDGVDAATAAGYLADALEELGEHAKNYGVPLVYEPLNRYETNMANTVEAGMVILRSLSTRNVVLLADLFHMNIEEANLPAAIRAGRGAIGHVHFVDSNRRPAGLGHIDFAPIVAALEEIEYQGYVSAEAFPYPDPDSAAERTMQAFRQYFRNDGA